MRKNAILLGKQQTNDIAPRLVNARTQSLICHPSVPFFSNKKESYIYLSYLREKKQNPTSSHFRRTKGLQLRFRKKYNHR